MCANPFEEVEVLTKSLLMASVFLPVKMSLSCATNKTSSCALTGGNGLLPPWKIVNNFIVLEHITVIIFHFLLLRRK